MVLHLVSRFSEAFSLAWVDFIRRCVALLFGTRYLLGNLQNVFRLSNVCEIFVVRESERGGTVFFVATPLSLSGGRVDLSPVLFLPTAVYLC